MSTDRAMRDAVQEALEAPDFSLIDTEGRAVQLSGYRGRRHVVLVFNRGFS